MGRRGRGASEPRRDQPAAVDARPREAARARHRRAGIRRAPRATPRTTPGSVPRTARAAPARARGSGACRARRAAPAPASHAPSRSRRPGPSTRGRASPRRRRAAGPRSRPRPPRVAPRARAGRRSTATTAPDRRSPPGSPVHPPGADTDSDEVLPPQVLDVPRQARARGLLEERRELEVERGSTCRPDVDACASALATLELDSPRAATRRALRRAAPASAVPASAAPERRAEPTREVRRAIAADTQGSAAIDGGAIRGHGAMLVARRLTAARPVVAPCRCQHS